MGHGSFHIQLVKNGMIHGEERWKFRIVRGSRRSDDIEHHDLVESAFQPTAWDIERLLGSDMPETTYRIAIHIDLSLTEGLHHQEGVTTLL